MTTRPVRPTVAEPAADPVPEPPPTAPRRRPSTEQLALLGFLAALVVAAQLVYPRFLTAGNLTNILSQGAPLGVVAVAMTFVLVGGGFDLSVGAMVAMCSVVYAQLSLLFVAPVALALALTLGLLLGLVNGLLVARMELNPFVATLATASIYGGLAYVVSGSAPILVHMPGFQDIGQGRVAGLPVSVWVLVAVAAVGAAVLARSVYGHDLYAIGGNAEAARLAGVRVHAARVTSYVLLGVAAAVAAIVLTSRLGVGQATIGADMTLDVITVVVIGGTSLFGGEGSVGRTVVGLLIIGVILNVSDSIGWGADIEHIVTGAVLLGAVGLDVLTRRRRARSGAF